MRLGWQNANEWKSVLPLLNESRVSQIVLHPRIGKQQYKGEVDKKVLPISMPNVKSRLSITAIYAH